MSMNCVYKKESNSLEWFAQTSIDVMALVLTISGESQC